jgi:hypothetical protein
MDRLDDTPTAKPGGFHPADSSAIPKAVVFERTDRLSKDLYNAVSGDDSEESALTPENFIEQLAEKLGEMTGGGGGGGGGQTKKEAKKQNIVAILLMLLIGPGGAMAVIYATRDEARSNTQDVEYLKKASKKLEPRVEDTEDNIRLIKVRVGTIDKSINAIETSQTAIAGGIEELKQENVKRLQDELDEAKRELRRRDRDR